MSSFKDLVVWNKSMDFAVEIYTVTKSFPSNEQFGLTSQLRRASSSIALNIAEGWGRGSNKTYSHFLKIARGSLYETETCLILSNKLGYISTEIIDSYSLLIEQIGKMINGLIKSIELKIEV
jgi:four helix bundle protein